MTREETTNQEICSVSNGWGEASTYIAVGKMHHTNTKIAKIEKKIKVIGSGYYSNLTINCYVAYGGDGSRIVEINEGPNVEVRYFNQSESKPKEETR